MPKIRGVRQRAREAVIEEITAEARRQLGAHGAPGLSLRAVARELEMASSGIYRYFTNRDELLTALIIAAYDTLGDEVAVAVDRSSGEPPAQRWLAAARAVRRWALANPHEYSLVYGTPVPGYEAPDDTVDPASRAALATIAMVVESHRAGLVDPPADVPVETGAAVRADIVALREEIDIDLPVDLATRVLMAWSELFGLISFELFGHTKNVISAHDEFFDVAALTLARTIGLASARPSTA